MSLLKSILLFLAFFAAVPSFAQEADTGPTGTIATENHSEIDAAMAVRIREILSELGGYDDITVTVSEGIVTLRGTANSISEASELTELVTRVEGVVAIKNEVTETTDIARRLNPAFDRFQARIGQLVTILPLLLISAAVFVAITFLGWLISSRRRPWDRLAPNAFIAALYRQLVMIAFVIGATVISLDILDASALLGTILGAAGIVGLAFGFAVRDTVENYIASIMLSIRQPFRPNDTIEINGDEGKVIRLTSRATILLSFDGNQIRIPNSTVFKSRIVNYSLNAERRFKFSIAVDWDADLSAVRHKAQETVQSLPFTLAEPSAGAWIEGIGDSGIEIVITGWINQHNTSIVLAKGEALRQVKMAIESMGVTLPETTYRIVMGNDEPISGSKAAKAPLNPRASDQTVETVESEENSALERIVDAERGLKDNEDLLRSDALHE